MRIRSAGRTPMNRLGTRDTTKERIRSGFSRLSLASTESEFDLPTRGIDGRLLVATTAYRAALRLNAVYTQCVSRRYDRRQTATSHAVSATRALAASVRE